MIIHDLHVFGTHIRPNKTESISIVDADAILAVPVTPEPFEAISGRNAEIFEPPRYLELSQLASSNPFDRLKPLDPSAAR